MVDAARSKRVVLEVRILLRAPIIQACWKGDGSSSWCADGCRSQSGQVRSLLAHSAKRRLSFRRGCPRQTFVALPVGFPGVTGEAAQHDICFVEFGAAVLDLNDVVADDPYPRTWPRRVVLGILAGPGALRPNLAKQRPPLFGEVEWVCCFRRRESGACIRGANPRLSHFDHGPVAKRPKAPVLHTGIPGFESLRDYH